MKPLKLLYLSQSDVITAGGLDMEQTLRAVEDVLGLLETGECELPAKTVLRWGGLEAEQNLGRINAMPAYVGGSYQMAGIKWIAGFPMNPMRHDLPRGIGMIVLNSVKSGVPLVVMDGTIVSAMRTGAVTGVAAKYLARPESEIVGLIGAGVQNRTQLLAVLTAIPNLKRAVVMDLSLDRARTFARDVSVQLGLPVDIEEDAERVARQSDILITATTSPDPVVQEDWWPEGCFYALVGSYNECTLGLIQQADKVVVDNWDEIVHRGTQSLARMHLTGRFSKDDLHAHMGEVVIGKKVGRTSVSERIHFCAVGMGIEDVAVATLIYNRAKAEGLGQTLELWEEPYAI